MIGPLGIFGFLFKKKERDRELALSRPAQKNLPLFTLTEKKDINIMQIACQVGFCVLFAVRTRNWIFLPWRKNPLMIALSQRGVVNLQYLFLFCHDGQGGSRG